MNEAVRIWMQGAIAMGYIVVACFFARFWRQTNERLFVLFSAGFVVLAIHRTLVALTDAVAVNYSLRLAGYLLILIAIIDRRVRA
ncbi:MAG: DUF5985 family protein [Thermoanaerobaculia bacterium]